jgi:peptidyl-prolyl cis-trans isomerase D
MQIIQNIRDKGAAVVIGVIALSLIGFIMMDAKQGSGTMFGSNNTTIGKINGESIEYKVFADKFKQAEEQYGGRISGNQVYSVRQSVWDQIVAEKVLTAEFEKLGLTFAPKELSSIMFSEESAPYTLKQAFTDKTTGRYDVEQVKQWWLNVKKMKGEQRDAINAQIIEPMKLQALYNKYNSMIAAGAYYPTWMQERDMAEGKNFAVISYVAVPYSVIGDSTIKITDQEVLNYIGKRTATYKQEGGRNISYIGFNANPSATDTLKALEAVTTLKAPFIADTNAKIFVSRNMSAINFSDGYVLKSKLTMSQKDSVAALPIGGVFGPYLDNKNFVVAKMLATRQLADSVKCRHILIGTNDPQSGAVKLEDSIAKKRIDSIEAAIKGGADFATLVTKYTDDEGSKDKKGEYDFTSAQFSSLAKEFAETIFYGSTGDKKVVKTSFGYHYIEVLNQKNFEPAYKLAYMAKEIIASDETVNFASSQATKVSGEARNAKALEAYVQKNGLKKIDVPTLIKENDFQLGGIQDARQVIKWAFEAKEGEVSEPFSVVDQFIVAVVTKVQPEGLPDAKTARPMVEFIIRNLKKAEAINLKLGKTPTLESAAAAYGGQISTSGADSSLIFAAQIVNGIGQEPKLIGAAFNKANQAKVSEPIAGNNGVYVIKVNSIGTKPADAPELIAQQIADKGKVMMQQTSYGWFEALKKLATIKDYRSKFN